MKCIDEQQKILKGYEMLKSFESKYMIKIDDIDNKVLDFVINSTKIFDDSHDFRHALIVADNALSMYVNFINNDGNDGDYNGFNKIDIGYDNNVSKWILYLSLFHDVCDYKYSDSIPREQLTEFINTTLGEKYNGLDDLIDIVSYSKQISIENQIAKKLELDIKQKFILDIVRSADRKESIGEIGILRLELYSKHKRNMTKQYDIDMELIHYSFEKLLRLIPYGYINNLFIDDEIIRRHNYIVSYVKNRIAYYKSIDINIIKKINDYRKSFMDFYDKSLLSNIY